MTTPTTASVGHTPGPWHLGPWGAWADHAIVVLDAHDEQIANTADLLKSWPECEANARLIAAAPELLAALAETRAVLALVLMRARGSDWNADPLRLTLTTGDAFTRIDAAIAKAEGRNA